MEELEAGRLKVTDVLLGDEAFGGGLFPYLYEETGGSHLEPQATAGRTIFVEGCPVRLSERDDRVAVPACHYSADLKQCPIKGEGRNGTFVLANVWFSQVCYPDRVSRQQPSRLYQKSN